MTPPLLGLAIMFVVFSIFELLMAVLAPQEKKLVWEFRSVGSLLMAAILYCTNLILDTLRKK